MAEFVQRNAILVSFADSGKKNVTHKLLVENYKISSLRNRRPSKIEYVLS